MVRRKKEATASETLEQVREGLTLLSEAVDALVKAIGDGDGDDPPADDPPEDPPANGRRKRGSKKKTRTRKGKIKSDGPSVDDVRTVGLKVVEEFGDDEMNKILKEFGDGCKRVSDLEEEFFQAVIDECETALAED